MRDFTIQFPNIIKPLKKTMLGVSLIHGRMRALAVVKDQVIGHWESQETIETSEQLQAALALAMKDTQYPGQKVSFLIDEKRFVHQYIQVPAMKLADLRLYLTNIIDEMKTWNGPAVWRFRTTQEARGKMGVLLDIWPQEFVDELIKNCQELELMPVQIVPLSATFVEQVRSLPLENDDIVLLVTLMSDNIALLVAKGDGTPLFERFLGPTCEGVEPSERIGREITRSILFCAQQFAINVSKVWMFGESSSATVASIQPFVGLPIMQSPMRPDPTYWIWVSLSLPVKNPCNFTSTEVRLAPLRKLLLKVTAAAVLGFLLLGVGLSSFLQGRLAGEQGQSLALAAQSMELFKEKEEWQTRLQKLTRQQSRIRYIKEQRLHPLPGLMLGYLGNVLPQELTLNKALITRKTNEWNVELTGMAPGDLVIGSQTLSSFEEHLREGPYHVEMTSDWRDAWLEEVSRQRQQDDSPRPRQFSMHGRIQG